MTKEQGFYNGAVWQSPSCMRAMVVFLDGDRWALLGFDEGRMLKNLQAHSNGVTASCVLSGTELWGKLTGNWWKHLADVDGFVIQLMAREEELLP